MRARGRSEAYQKLLSAADTGCAAVGCTDTQFADADDLVKLMMDGWERGRNLVGGGKKKVAREFGLVGQRSRNGRGSIWGRSSLLADDACDFVKHFTLLGGVRV